MKLTPLEREILNHRLAVPECISGVLADERFLDDFPDEAAKLHDRVEDLCSLLIDGRFDEAVESDARLTYEVLVDAVDGSTYYGTEVDGDSPQKLAAIERASLSLARKVTAFTGLPCNPPLC